MEQNEKLLEEYKKYDYLNKDKNNPLIKIFVSYIKPSFLFKSEILTPIHLGRAVAKESSKDGVISNEDLKWLYENCIGDDDFKGNISSTNRRVGFLTGTYFAYKNYEKLGNPEYFGSFGYRKIFPIDCLKEISDYDVIIPSEENFKKWSNKDCFIDYHGSNLFNSLFNAINNRYPNEIEEFKEYLDTSTGYYHEIYIMRKNIFFEFCNWIFPLLDILLKDNNCKVILDNSKKDKISMQRCSFRDDKRDIAYIIELYTGYFLYKLTKNPDIKTKKLPVIKLNMQEDKKNYTKNILSLIREKMKEKV